MGETRLAEPTVACFDAARRAPQGLGVPGLRLSRRDWRGRITRTAGDGRRRKVIREIPGHYNRNAETYMEAGLRLGWVMADLLNITP
jgi:hypothetical protein